MTTTYTPPTIPLPFPDGPVEQTVLKTLVQYAGLPRDARVVLSEDPYTFLPIAVRNGRRHMRIELPRTPHWQPASADVIAALGSPNAYVEYRSAGGLGTIVDLYFDTTGDSAPYFLRTDFPKGTILVGEAPDVLCAALGKGRFARISDDGSVPKWRVYLFHAWRPLHVSRRGDVWTWRDPEAGWRLAVLQHDGQHRPYIPSSGSRYLGNVLDYLAQGQEIDRATMRVDGTQVEVDIPGGYKRSCDLRGLCVSGVPRALKDWTPPPPIQAPAPKHAKAAGFGPPAGLADFTSDFNYAYIKKALGPDIAPGDTFVQRTKNRGVVVLVVTSERDADGYFGVLRLGRPGPRAFRTRSIDPRGEPIDMAAAMAEFVARNQFSYLPSYIDAAVTAYANKETP